MGFFDEDDPFDSIIREFFGGRQGVPRRQKETIIRGEEEDRNIDFIESDENIFLVFELPGYNEKDVIVMVKGKELEISARKNNKEEIQDYLTDKLRRGMVFRRDLPNSVNLKKFSHSMRNGVLEIVFEKRK